MEEKHEFYKRKPSDKIWWVNHSDEYGRLDFSFDRKKIYSFWGDYPDNLTPAQKVIFDKENPYWANFYKEE